MKLLTQTPTQLVLQDRPIGIKVFGGIFGLISLGLIGFIAVSPNKSILQCERPSTQLVTCQLQTYNWIGQHDRRSVSPVIAVEQGESRGAKGGGFQYLLLVTPTEKVEIPASKDRIDTIADLQVFLGNARSTSLAIEYSLIFSSLLLGTFLVCILAPIPIWFISYPYVDCTFDKSAQKIVLKSSSLGITKVSEYPIEAVRRVEIEEEKTNDEKKTKKSSSNRIVLWLSETEKVPLTREHLESLESANSLARSIREFLHLTDSDKRLTHSTDRG